MTGRRRTPSRVRKANAPPRRVVAAERATGSTPPPGPGVALFPIVGIGASAGGLEAFVQLLSLLPAATGMGFVLIQHLDAAHPSFLREALAKATAMPVVEPVDGTRVEPDHVYVIPPAADLTIHEGRLMLRPRPDDGRAAPHLPVDLFMRSLAGERGSHAVGVVLSGTASDGTDGLRAIKAGDGITLVQEPGSAKFPGMPRSAIDAGVVDHVLAIPELAEELVRLSHHPYVTVAARPAPASDDAAFAGILATVRSRVGVDFGEYKRATLERRITRRMALRRVDDLRQYLALLHSDPDEVGALYEDVLIHVTSFFRDPEVFEILARRVFPELLAHKPDDAPLRMWVAGCSSGEEVYSLAIALLEVLGESTRQVQIFGSDVSARAIEKARAGLYPDSALRELSDERRHRWFVRTEHGQRIVKAVRDRCVFVEHDLARDPPFSKLDLVSCRNVLIYFETGLQQRVISRLHYALNEPGYLLLGRTENIPGSGELFSVVDRAHKIFARSAAPSTLRFSSALAAPLAGAPPPRPASAEPAENAGNLVRHIDRLLLARYAPPGVVVDDKLEILSFRGDTGAYLRPAAGKPQHNLMKMARGGLLSALRETMARAKQQRTTVRAEGVKVDHDGVVPRCDLVVIPWVTPRDSAELLYVVLFEEPRGAPPLGARRARKKDEPRIATLEHELAATRDYLNALIDEQGRTNDDLGSANEELVSGNEELQSMNEELETAKEELQSTNEELTTVNDELHSRNQELALVNSDLVNVLGTVDIPLLILDRERRLRRYTPNARSIARVQPTDVGRPIDDIKLHIDVRDLDAQIAEVIATLHVRESEVHDASGRWYRMQIRPYHTTDGRVDGAILSLVDIDALKQLVEDAQHARGEAERANLSKDQFLATLSHELRSPLTSVLIHAQRLRGGGLDDTKVRRAGEAIERGTRMQVQLIEDLLDVSRIVAGKLELRREAVDLAAIIHTAIEGVRALAERKRIRLVAARGAAPEVRVAGDATRLVQVVSNLLTNAIKFTPDGGEVTVTLAAADGVARIDVTDTGVGIEAGFLPQVFDRFAQEDSSSTRIYGGLGLGLAIVRHLVELHGGTVRAFSAGKGTGTTMSVTLPLVAAVDAAPPIPPTVVVPPVTTDTLQDVHILVVDDDAATREAVAEALQQSGAAVTLAASAAEAMVAVEAAAPDVVVCDLAMPGEDGFGFIRLLRTLDGALGRATPALALTALAGAADQRRALDAGFDRHLAKPVDTAQLVAAVAELRPRTLPSSLRRAEVR